MSINNRNKKFIAHWNAAEAAKMKSETRAPDLIHERPSPLPAWAVIGILCCAFWGALYLVVDALAWRF